MDAKVVWQDSMTFDGSAGTSEQTGLSIRLDAHPKVGGDDSGFRPLELMAIGLVGCTAMDVISVLRKKRQEITAFEVKTHIEQAADHPHVFTQIEIEYVLTGRGIQESAVERAIELSSETYCPAQAMLAKVAPMNLKYTIVEAE